MITIPKEIRKKNNIQPGSEVAIVELEGIITVIPIKDIKSTRNITLKEMEQSIEESREEELRLENDAKKMA
jgi:AbrB family looped-hinge helix DNA binding protein